MPRLPGPSRGISTGSSESAAASATGALAGLAVLAGLVCGGCASLSPPVAFDTERPTRPQPGASRDGLSVAPVEGRPSGLVLQLGADAPLADEGTLEIQRGRGDSTTTLRRLSLDDRIAERLAGRGLRFVDRSPPSAERLTYRVVQRRDGSTERRVVLDVPWGESPSEPEELDASAASTRAVEVRWTPSTSPAVLFRRNVTAGQQEVRRVATVAGSQGGTFLDRDVRPGAVYAYRVAVARRHPGFLQLGPRSRTFYVSVPDHGTSDD